ncbi:MAG: DNA recombination protein RmuC [Propionicimonas sp.]|uniref:DNA recombination protein RmuC n=1 Tax=Propionicimonas sp. TaxID=1955623 RepID=UPI002B211BA3|nr:DNA recombination protein RmuC [Propionicimonas sp.]MEA4943545.1 DNA recombination protein RmuC [Propionicimonas sp.]MEA5116556.1 DNA recombination protein RmuC [Propionicimonas sp.]
MDDVGMLIAGLLVGIVVGAAAAWLVARAELARAQAGTAGALAERDAARERAAEIVADRENQLAHFRALSAELLQGQTAQVEQSAEQRLRATESLMAPMRETLEAFRQQLGEVEKERAALATDLRNQVTAVKQTGDQLRTETAALVSALRKPQVRGNWGEQQLRRVVELAGMLEHCDFAEQQTTRNDSGATVRPDLMVMLAGGKRIYVDSKVPLAAFLDACEAGDEPTQAQHLRRFARHVQTHVDQLSRKDYFTAETASPEFVVLFLPSEALAAEAFSQLPDLHEYAAARGIVLASPTSLIAMLKTIAYAWRQEAVSESAREVFRLGRELYDRLGTLGKHFNQIGKSLTGAVASYNAAVGSIEHSVFPSARRLRELKVVDSDLLEVRASDASVRQLGAPELIEDAAAVPTVLGRESA